jgi:hypothetical protein
MIGGLIDLFSFRLMCGRSVAAWPRSHAQGDDADRGMPKNTRMAGHRRMQLGTGNVAQ